MKGKQDEICSKNMGKRYDSNSESRRRQENAESARRLASMLDVGKGRVVRKQLVDKSHTVEEAKDERRPLE